MSTPYSADGPNRTHPTAKKARPSLHDKAIAETQRAAEAAERARVMRAEAERRLDHLVGSVLRSAARTDATFREAMRAKLRAAKLTRREAAEIQHLLNAD